MSISDGLIIPLVDITLKPTLKQHNAWQFLNDKDTMFLFFGGGAGGG